MTTNKTSLLDQAKAYVEAQDYLFDENREIAGKAYMAGFARASEEVIDELKLLLSYTQDENPDPRADLIETALIAVKRRLHV